MPCKQWNEEWVAHLYDELDRVEERRLNEHLADCGDCRRRLEELSASREFMRSCSPQIPATPRVVILQPRSFFQPFWAYAAGAACALLLFAIGLFAGYRLPGLAGGGSTGATLDSMPGGSNEIIPLAAGRGTEALQGQIDLIMQRLSDLEQASARPAVAGPPDLYLTQKQFQDEMSNYRRAYDARHARDFEFLLGEITATELRTGTYIDETREALRWVAMRNDPRFSER
jgi:hypothetical protein